MNHELAKQLKDAGFPQKEPLVCEPGNTNVFTAVYYPTLSELIEACGDGIMLSGNNTQTFPWIAQSRGFQGVGKSPEEAVAKLWLELNK